jgi:thiol-disulfide isomerase/thioredoxin
MKSSSLRRLSSIRLLIAFAFAAVSTGHASAAPNPVGMQAPHTVRPDVYGKPFDSSVFNGKVILVNFWATWCGPCRIEIPKFIEWQKELGPKGLQVVGVSMDDTADAVRTAAKQLQFNYPLIMADAALAKSYGGVLGLPVTFLINRDGQIVHRYEGAKLPELRADIVALLDSPHH